MLNPYALVYLFAYMVPAAIGFLALILYTHLLSPAEYGIYVVGASVAGIVSALCFYWIRLSVSRYQARSPELDLRAEAIIAYAAATTLVACLAPAAILIVRPDIGLAFIAAAVFFSLANNAFEISQEFKRAQFNPLRFMSTAVIRSLSALALGYAAIELGGGGLGLLLAIGASFLIGALLSFRRNATKPLRFSSIGYLKQFIYYGLPFSLGALVCTLHNALDRLAVAYLFGQSGAGYYGLAADMARQFIVILASSVASAMFPIAFRSLAESGALATRERLKEGIELLLALLVPVTVWLAISADVVAKTLLGVEFQDSVATLLPLLAVGRMFGALNLYYLQLSFQLAEKPLLQVTHDTLILVLNLVLLFPLTHVFGLPGAAAAVLMAEGLGILIGVGFSRKAFWLPLNGPGLLRVLASTSMMAAVVYITKIANAGHGLVTLLSMLGSGGVAYAGSAMLFDVAGIRTSVASFFYGRSVPAE